ncbi:hypothetical protein GCM10007094_23070 [Pseudovibrio japonicus]|uniref:Uncharacterized protein n=1 Tax=Pseudovibrio japonicus TaxID=366534 RepID=A0ABQ3EG53_9HYPH|nr:hypothetical protein [Pseudovibrio japonicus]GHB33667.1 hypothetical protein GCM10007094_23070 [Pseudovibrio japonicus]
MRSNFKDCTYGPALKAFLDGIENQQCRSGRTTRMLDAVKEGDVVVCWDAAHARHIRFGLEERELRDVRLVTLGTQTGSLPMTSGHVHFDHYSLLHHFHTAIVRAQQQVEDMVKVMAPEPDPMHPLNQLAEAFLGRTDKRVRKHSNKESDHE